MSMKKIRCILKAAIMLGIVGSLTACGGSASTEGTTAATIAATKPAPTEPVMETEKKTEKETEKSAYIEKRNILIDVYYMTNYSSYDAYGKASVLKVLSKEETVEIPDYIRGSINIYKVDQVSFAAFA